jgi:hypothetical protein
MLNNSAQSNEVGILCSLSLKMQSRDEISEFTNTTALKVLRQMTPNTAPYHGDKAPVIMKC